MRASILEHLTDEADLKLAGLSLWVRSRQFPDIEEYWDGNWLDITCKVEAQNAYAQLTGPYLRTDEIEAFSDQLAKIQNDLTGEALLECMEPNLNVTVQCKPLGHLDVVISITPNHLTQSHVFRFELDQSYLASVLSGCRRILRAFPVVGGL